jgi:sterol desaturase/sphingolipid hydroxylase (fatty acid hydroxylase superfamily)
MSINTFPYIMATHLLTYWTGSLIFILADFSGRFKDMKLSDPLLGRRPHPSPLEHVMMIFISLANQIMAIPLIYLASPYVVSDRSNMTYLPIYQLGFYVVIGDMWFYMAHRYMHMNRTLYNNVHSYHHMYRYPVAVGTLFADPIEHLFCNVMSIMIGPLISPASSMALLLLWVSLVTANGLIAHCGYKLPFIDSKKHDTHHRLMIYNYGTLGLSDRLFGTYRS